MNIVCSGTNHRVHYGPPPLYAQDRACNRLESASGQLDITPIPGVQHDISADDEAVPLPLTYMPRILLHMERPALSLQQAALGGSFQDPVGATQPTSYVQALRETSARSEYQ